MHIRPAEPIAGSSAIELWDEDRRAATIYAQRAGIHILCEPGYEPGKLEIELQHPDGVQIAITRAD